MIGLAPRRIEGQADIISYDAFRVPRRVPLAGFVSSLGLLACQLLAGALA